MVEKAYLKLREWWAWVSQEQEERGQPAVLKRS